MENSEEPPFDYSLSLCHSKVLAFTRDEEYVKQEDVEGICGVPTEEAGHILAVLTERGLLKTGSEPVRLAVDVTSRGPAIGYESVPDHGEFCLTEEGLKFAEMLPVGFGHETG